MNRFVWPLVGFVLLVVLLAVGLNLNPREVPSPLVGKPAPAFTLARLDAPEKTFSPQDMRGQVWQRLADVTPDLPCHAAEPPA